jgi:hypothetical protein
LHPRPAESFVDFELFARSKEAFSRESLTLDGGVPSHDTFRVSSG